jgi:hypothetical protein
MILRHGHHLCRNHVKVEEEEKGSGKNQRKRIQGKLSVEVKMVVEKKERKRNGDETRSVDAFQVRQG